jgi:hypothetical protein
VQERIFLPFSSSFFPLSCRSTAKRRKKTFPAAGSPGRPFQPNRPLNTTSYLSLGTIVAKGMLLLFSADINMVEK